MAVILLLSKISSGRIYGFKALMIRDFSKVDHNFPDNFL